MDISLDGIVFHDRAPQTVAKCVADFFAGKSDAEPQKYIDLYLSADKLKWRAGEKQKREPITRAACWLTDYRLCVYASGSHIVI